MATTRSTQAPALLGHARSIAVDVNGLSEQLGISVQTLYRWRSEGRDMPPAFKVGGAVRWRQEAIDKWIAEQERAEAS